ncbi:MAG TPA: hypothetical protein VGP92_09205 [Acidimicrobiia bacterium]|nr:hypothetical protein [Acidimicrobiia bacterium]
MARADTTTPRRRRSREGWGVLAALVLAGASGGVAAHFGTTRSWENTPASAATSTSVPTVDPQRIP